MKSGKPKLAPKVKSPNKNSPNFMRESIHADSNSSPQRPMKKKNLSK